jgi:hypothetical protein
MNYRKNSGIGAPLYANFSTRNSSWGLSIGAVSSNRSVHVDGFTIVRLNYTRPHQPEVALFRILGLEITVGVPNEFLDGLLEEAV